MRLTSPLCVNLTPASRVCTTVLIVCIFENNALPDLRMSVRSVHKMRTWDSEKNMERLRKKKGEREGRKEGRKERLLRTEIGLLNYPPFQIRRDG